MKFQMTILLFVLILNACNGDYDNHNHPQLSSGKEYFDLHCSGCHGYNGKGKFLEGVPANIFTKFTRQEIVGLILRGRANENRNMPVFANMPAKEANKIVSYLKHLKYLNDKSSADDRLIIKP